MSTTADIFLSYSRDEQSSARLFAEGFEAAGFSVWWDVTLKSGEDYDRVTEEALRGAKAVVVLWSAKSVESRWVRTEATIALQSKTLVPVMITPCQRPIMFELTQTADLSHWNGDAQDSVWLTFLHDVQQFVQRGVAAQGTAKQVSESPTLTPVSPSPRRPPLAAQRNSTIKFWLKAVPLALLVAVVGIYAGWQLKPSPPAGPINRFSYELPAELQLRRQGENVIALSPDGRNLVINTTAGLYLRSMETLEGRIIAGTEEDLDTPFFSADSQSVAYWTPSGTIKRINLSGGAPVVLAQGISNPQGASWNASGTIVVADDDGIKRFPATGGAPELLFPVGEGETFQGPQLLPDGDTVLYAIGKVNAWDEARIVAQSIATGAQALLVEGGSAARYLATGHIVFARGNDLLAVAFNPATLTTSGAVVPLVQGVLRSLFTVTGLANYGVSDDGSLVYMASSAPTNVTRTPVWVDREGQVTESGVRPCLCSDPAVSPDGTRIAFKLEDNAYSAIWIWSHAQGTFTRLTFGDEEANSPVWSPDGERIAYGTEAALFMRRADGAGSIDRLLEGFYPAPLTWTAEGELVYSDLSFSRGVRDIGVLSLTGDPAPLRLLASEASETRADLSPDGRWLAYESNESGQPEIYVRPYPDVDNGRWQVSQEGGSMPQWSADSRTLFFFSNEAVMAVPIIEAPTLVFDPPQPLFSRRSGYANLESSTHAYGVAPDGERLLMLQASRLLEGAPEIVIVQNWFEELKRLVPVE